MSSRITVFATFSDGTKLQRGSATRGYSHAWFARGTLPERKCGDIIYPPKTWDKSGFSSNAAQCARNMAAETAWYEKNGKIEFAEVVQVTKLPTLPLAVPAA